MKKTEIVKSIQSILNDPSFKDNHRTGSGFFVRNRKLTFIIMILLILRKGLKSVQLLLNEFFTVPAVAFSVISASAFTQARAKLLHTAFIELNRKAVVEQYYADGNYRTWRGFRLLAIDGSKIMLPKQKEIIKHFGSIRIANQIETTSGEFPVAVASVLYDVLNNIAPDSILAPAKAYEVDLAIEHLSSCTGIRDLLIVDRNYPSYRFLSSVIRHGAHFLARCSRSSFREARDMFHKRTESLIAVIRPHHSRKKEIASLGLPSEITVRFIRIVLNTGETEVLVTSLTDELLYKTEDFKELYHKRWGIETFYSIVKGRLNLENFSGRTVESVRQDFYSLIFLSGLESVLTEDARQQTEEKISDNRYPQRINKSVSFNTIKNHVIELFYTENDTDRLLEKLTLLFKTSPVSKRDKRNVPRKKSSPASIINYYKRIKKICF
jgi:hypothetical protein